MGKRLGGWLFVALLGVGAFLAGRWSVVPDDRELRDSLAVWKEHRKDDARFKDSTRSVILAERARGDSAEQAAVKWENIAAARTVVANRHRERADFFAAALATATTPEDSLRACMAEVLERRSECAQVREANGALVEAARADDSAKAALRRENAVHLGQRARDSSRLAEADGLIVKLEKAVGGCRVPLIGMPCPLPLGGYNLTVKRAEFGGVVPFKVGRFRVGGSLTWSP